MYFAGPQLRATKNLKSSLGTTHSNPGPWPGRATSKFTPLRKGQSFIGILRECPSEISPQIFGDLIFENLRFKWIDLSKFSGTKDLFSLSKESKRNIPDQLYPVHYQTDYTFLSKNIFLRASSLIFLHFLLYSYALNEEESNV